MITKKRLKELIESVYDLECVMENKYTLMSASVADEKYKKRFSDLAAEERQHEEIVLRLKSYIDECYSAADDDV